MTKEEQERRVTSWSEENMGIDLEEGKTNQIIETPWKMIIIPNKELIDRI